MLEGVTFAVFLTAAGCGVAAALITGLVSLLKATDENGKPVVPWLGAQSGARLAFLGSGILYVLTALATNVSTLDAGLGVFVAWLTCATAAVGVHKAIVKPIAAAVNSTPNGG